MPVLKKIGPPGSVKQQKGGLVPGGLTHTSLAVVSISYRACRD